jgi:carbonic anhydrase
MAGLAGGGLVGAGQAPAADFAYAGDAGPGFWAELDPAWAACAGAGGRQSPIDLSPVVVDPGLEPLQLEVEPTPIALINNGHVIEEEYEAGSTLQFEGVVYHLAQFHFHTLSEHTVRGQRGVMELHAVFHDDPVNPTKTAVVGMRYTIGRANRFLATLLAYGLPEKAGDRVEAPDDINLADGLTDTASYYTYPGSLTTPPCSENVITALIPLISLHRGAKSTSGHLRATLPFVAHYNCIGFLYSARPGYRPHCPLSTKRAFSGSAFSYSHTEKFLAEMGWWRSCLVAS